MSLDQQKWFASSPYTDGTALLGPNSILKLCAFFVPEVSCFTCLARQLSISTHLIWPWEYLSLCLLFVYPQLLMLYLKVKKIMTKCSKEYILHVQVEFISEMEVCVVLEYSHHYINSFNTSRKHLIKSNPDFSVFKTKEIIQLKPLSRNVK